MGAALPSFERPPVRRVQTSFAIDRGDASMRDLFAFYDEHLAADYPHMHEHDSMEPPREMPWGESPSIQIDLSALLPLASRPSIQLHAFSQERDWELRLQRDWVAVQWRRQEESYPRWAAVRERADACVGPFVAQFGGEIVGVEVRYFNVIKSGAAASILAMPFAGKDLGPIESLQLHSHHQVELGDANARLHLDVSPSGDPLDDLLHLSLTVRGRPESPEPEAALDFADGARRIIVTGFEDITPDEFHELWGKETDE